MVSYERDMRSSLQGAKDDQKRDKTHSQGGRRRDGGVPAPPHGDEREVGEVPQHRHKRHLQADGGVGGGEHIFVHPCQGGFS